ncbi:MAG TPA: hypothetical protein VMH33_10815 [Solirubrobacterales bacterium]|nr:hypothetical protein [Solirubrobacterales bacterium]
MTRKVKAALVLALAAGIGLIVVPGASAEWLFKEKLGEHTTEPSFSRAVALTVDPVSGDVLVADSTAKTISRFKPNGEPDPFSALGTNVISGVTISTNVNAAQVVIAPPGSAGGTAGDIYVAQAPSHMVSIFAASGEYLGSLTQFNEGEHATGGSAPLGRVTGVSVDSSGTVYVSDETNNEIHKYGPTANPATNANNSANFIYSKPMVQVAGAGPSQGAIFVENSSGVVKNLNTSSGQECPGEGLSGVANLALNRENGQLLANLELGGKVLEYDGGCPLSLLPGSPFQPGFGISTTAVDGAHSFLYVVKNLETVVVYREVGLAQVKTLPVTSVGLTSATLEGVVKPNGALVTECFFKWGESESYGHTLPCAEYESGGIWHPISALSELGTGSAFIPVRAQIAPGGLKVGTEYHFQLFAANANNEVGHPSAGGDKKFLTLGPSLRAEAAAEVGEEAAILSAEVNPNGKLTSYQVQYVSEAKFAVSEWDEAEAVPVTPASVGQGSEFSTVYQHVSGLALGTSYRFRFLATNPDGSNEGTGGSFTTFPATPEDLLDGRAYELITPVEKKGEPIPPEPDVELGGSCDPVNPCLPGAFEAGQSMQAAPDGESVLYSGQAFAAGFASGRNTYVSSRGPSGWNWGGISPKTQTGTWEACSSSLSRCVLAQTEPPLSPESPVRGGEAFANLYLRDQSGILTPLVTAEPPNRDPGGANDDFTINFVAANSGTTGPGGVGAFTDIVFEADDALTPAVAGIAPEAPPVQAGLCAESNLAGVPCDLYKWSDGHLSLVNVAPGNSSAFGKATIGSGRLLELNRGLEAPAVDNAVSADGRTIFWTSEETGQAYARIDGESTLEIPGPGTCKASVSLSSRACFLTASQDGREVLLSNGELFALGGGAYGFKEDLTEGKGGFKGYLATGEESGGITRVYFADSKALSGAPTPEEGYVNLYYWHQGVVRLVASLPEGDENLFVGFGDWRAPQADRTAQATSDGRYLTFMSRAPLTGYDNIRPSGPCSGRDSRSVCAEVFEYSAEDGTLTCPSCNPTGEAPLGSSNLTRLWVGPTRAPDFRQPQNLPAEGEGRIFFESQDALSPRDRNGNIQDIYEWEPKGVGDCDSEFAEGGCVRLISSGRSETDSAFLDATPSGDDAFFITRSKLLPVDKNEQLDLYDARAPHTPGEAVGFPEVPKPTPCEGEACLGATSEAPSQPGGASGTLVGAGNPPPTITCPKSFTAKKNKCVAKPKHHKKKKKHKQGGKGKKKGRRADRHGRTGR